MKSAIAILLILLTMLAGLPAEALAQVRGRKAARDCSDESSRPMTDLSPAHRRGEPKIAPTYLK